VMGTIQYMSPEQALGRRLDHRSDIFSFGTVLYEMATGRLPFSGATAMEIINHIINTEPEWPSRLNTNVLPGLERIVLRCLEKRIESRFQTASELLNDLRRSEPGTHFPAHRIVSRHNLPRQLSQFVGRQREIREVQRLMTDARLVTLTGSGGVGKTRLALQVAFASLNQYADGVWFVDLAPLLEAAFVPQTVASALGLREEPNRSIFKTLTDFLERRELLLVLDNCEHLVGACAPAVDKLICPSTDLLLLVH